MHHLRFDDAKGARIEGEVTEAASKAATRGVVANYLHTSAYVSIRQHTSAYVSILQHTSAYVMLQEA
jgi:hypothetical protein